MFPNLEDLAKFSLLNIFKRSAENPSNPLSDVFLQGNGTSSKETVNQKTAMSFSAVAACIRIISQTIASLPVQIIQEDSEGNKAVLKTHPLYYLISKRPNNMMTKYSFFEAMLTNALLTGDAFAVVKRSSITGIAERIDFILDNSKVKIEINESKQTLFYKIEGYAKKLSQLDVLHFKWKTLDGITGISPIEYFKETIGNGIATSKFQGDFYGNAGRLDGYISIDGSFESTEQQDRFRTSWRKTYSGQGKERVAVLEQGAQYKPLSINQTDAQFIQTSKFNIEEIARIYGVPQHLLQSLDKATFNNIEEQGIDFVRHTIRPFLESIEPELDYNLLTEKEKRDGNVYCNFDESALLRGDLKTQAESVKNLVFSSVMTPNEARKRLSINKSKNSNADELQAQSAMVLLKDLNAENNGENKS